MKIINNLFPIISKYPKLSLYCLGLTTITPLTYNLLSTVDKQDSFSLKMNTDEKIAISFGMGLLFPITLPSLMGYSMITLYQINQKTPSIVKNNPDEYKLLWDAFDGYTWINIKTGLILNQED